MEGPAPSSSAVPADLLAKDLPIGTNDVSSILYVEDEEDYRILVTDILGSAGLEVETAATCKAGLEALLKRRPSVLILDINLPDGDGYSICRQLRQDPAYADLPILMLTVRRRPEEWLRGFSSGANDYLSKPFNPSELVERVVNSMEGKVQRLKENGSPEYRLIQAAVAGNRPAFEVLIQQYRERLTDNLRAQVRDAVLLEDIISQAFARAFEQLSQYRGQASFYTWLYRIALNEVLIVSQKPAGVSLEELNQDDECIHPASVDSREPLDEALMNEQSRTQVRQALERLPEDHRRVVELYFLHDLSCDEVAKELKIPSGTVRSRLFKARKLLAAVGHRMASRPLVL